MLNFTKIKNIENSLNKEEISIEGEAASPGISIGRVFIYDRSLRNISYRHILSTDISSEKSRFFSAVQDTTDQINALMKKAQNALDKNNPLSSVLDAYQHMLKGSRLMRGVCSRIENHLVNAEAAISDEVSSLSEVFEAMDDPYISARIEDIRNIASRILRNLQTNADDDFSFLPENAIVISKNLSITDTSLLNAKNISGIITINGSKQGHIALLSRSLGLPAIVNTPDLLSKANTNDIIIIDGTYGKIILNPTNETLTLYRKYRSDFLHWKRSLYRLRDLPSTTTDGVYISLNGNLDITDEADFLNQTGTDGIGLFRSEYMYINRNDVPSVNEQLNSILEIGNKVSGTITFRTLDIGADKYAPTLGNYQATNPALGLRGIRYAKNYKKILRDQFEAVLLASNSVDIRVMIPMISCTDEFIFAKNLFEETAQDLYQQGNLNLTSLPKIGAMIETPSAALEAENLAEYADFFSIGTNDLIQYTLAVDRTDSFVEYLYNPLSPAVLKLIKITIDAANKKNIPVCICGDMAANHKYSPLLIGLGVRALSMPAINIPMIKEKIRSLSICDMNNLANYILTLSSSTEIETALKNFENGTRF